MYLCLLFFLYSSVLGFAQLDSDKYCFHCLVLPEQYSKLKTIISTFSSRQAPTAIPIKIERKKLIIKHAFFFSLPSHPKNQRGLCRDSFMTERQLLGLSYISLVCYSSKGTYSVIQCAKSGIHVKGMYFVAFIIIAVFIVLLGIGKFRIECHVKVFLETNETVC